MCGAENLQPEQYYLMGEYVEHVARIPLTGAKYDAWMLEWIEQPGERHEDPLGLKDR